MARLASHKFAATVEKAGGEIGMYHSFLFSDQSFSLVAVDGGKSLLSCPLNLAGDHGLLVRPTDNGKFRLVGGAVIALRKLNDRVIEVAEGHDMDVVNGHFNPTTFSAVEDVALEVRGMFEVIDSL